MCKIKSRDGYSVLPIGLQQPDSGPLTAFSSSSSFSRDGILTIYLFSTFCKEALLQVGDDIPRRGLCRTDLESCISLT